MSHNKIANITELRAQAAFPKILDCSIRIAQSIGAFSKISESPGLGASAEKSYVDYYWKLGDSILERFGSERLTKSEAMLNALTDEELYELCVGDPGDAKKTLLEKGIDKTELDPLLEFITSYRM